MAPFQRQLCLYVSGHGLGHAARVVAVVEQLLARGGWRLHLRSGAPRWFFDGVLGPDCDLAELPDLDPGVIQSDSFTHDIPATLSRWRALLGQAPQRAASEARVLRERGCQLVLTDVAPLGCAAAAAAGLPCVVLGNFTWDWILADYVGRDRAFAAVIAHIARLYRSARLYLRLPMSPETELFAHQRDLPFTTRRATCPPEQVRLRLGLAHSDLMVLISFGGFGVRELCLDRVPLHPGVRCVWDRGPARPPALLSARGLDVSYPDLIRAADVVLTKPGFSIISESVAGRTALAYAPRPGFRESALLERFLRRTWPSVRLAPGALADGSWVDQLVAWWCPRRRFPALPHDGAARAAQLLEQLL